MNKNVYVSLHYVCGASERIQKVTSKRHITIAHQTKNYNRRLFLKLKQKSQPISFIKYGTLTDMETNTDLLKRNLINQSYLRNDIIVSTSIV